MKKIILSAIVFLFLATLSMSAHAGSVVDGGSTKLGDQMFHVSKGVYLYFTLNTNTYNAYSWHKAGSKWYSTDQDSGVISHDCSGSACGTSDPSSSSSSS